VTELGVPGALLELTAVAAHAIFTVEPARSRTMTDTQIGAGIIGVISRENPMSKLGGKVAVVTGASKGIGAGSPRPWRRKALRRGQLRVEPAGAMAVVDAITAAGGRAIPVKGDVSQGG